MPHQILIAISQAQMRKVLSGGLIGDADNDYGNVTIHHSIAFNAEITTAATSTTGAHNWYGKSGGLLHWMKNYANAAMKINGVTVGIQ